MSAGFKVFRDNMDANAWQALGLLEAPLSAIVIGVTS